MLSPSTAQAVSANLARQAQLAASLSDLQHVPSAITEQKQTVHDLKRQLHGSEEKIARLFAQTQAARKATEVGNTEPRKFTQFFNKKKSTSGDMSRASPELQAAYNSAVQEEKRERAQETNLQECLKAAQSALDDLADQAAEYASVKAELRKVYESVFDGPTLDFPEEDRLEHQLKAAKAACDRVEAVLQIDAKVCDLVEQALRIANDCREKLDQANYYSSIVATTFGRDRTTNSADHSALASVSTAMKKVSEVLDKARKLSSNVGEVKLSIFSEDLFTSPNDPKLHVKIKDGLAEAERIHAALQIEQKSAHARWSASKAVADEALQGREACQEELDSARAKIFQDIAKRLQEGGPISGDGELELSPPPSYVYTPSTAASSSVPSLLSPQEPVLRLTTASLSRLSSSWSKPNRATTHPQTPHSTHSSHFPSRQPTGAGAGAGNDSPSRPVRLLPRPPIQSPS